MALNLAGCGLYLVCPQYIESAAAERFEKNPVKRKISPRNFLSRQNAKIKSVTILSPFFVAFMLTDGVKKVLVPTCGKTCGECGKLNIFKDISPDGVILSTAKTPRKSSQNWRNLRLQGNYVDTCTWGKNHRFFTKYIQFLTRLSKKRESGRKRDEYFCGNFTKRVFV